MGHSFEEQLDQAENLLIAGEIEAGLQQLALLEETELNHDQMLTLAELYYELGHMEKAKKLLEPLIAVADIDGQLLMAEIQLDEGEIEDAWAELLLCKEEYPNHLRLLVLLADTSMLLDMPEVAYEYIDHARQLAPHDTSIQDAWHYVRTAAGLEIHTDMETEEPELLSDQRLELEGDDAAYSGHFEEALACYQELLQRDAKSVTILYKAGFIASQLKDYILAESYLKEVIRQDPEYIQAYRLLGEAYYHQQDLEQAQTMWNRYLTYNPEDAEIAIQLLTLYVQQHRYGEAESLIHRLQADLEEYPPYWYLVGELYRGQDKWEEAATAYQACIQRSSDYQDVHWAYARVLQELEQIPEAIQAMRHHLSLNPEDKVAWKDMGYLLLENGEVSEAIVCWEHSLHIDPYQEEILEIIQRYQEE